MKTQLISRENLNKIYLKACSGGQSKIDVALKEQRFNDKIEVGEKELLEGYAAADMPLKKLIKEYFEINIPKSIIKQVGDFDDILRISGKKLKDIIPWKEPKNKQQISQNAFAKIQLISEVYNEGWIPDFNNSNESKYFPYFEKNAPGGWGFCGSCSYGWSSFCRYGFGSLFKTRELSDNAGIKFLSIFKEYLPE